MVSKNQQLEFIDINVLFSAIDWIGRGLTVYEIGKLLPKLKSKLQPIPKIYLWNGRTKGLRPIVENGKLIAIKNPLEGKTIKIEEKEVDISQTIHCLTCFSNAKIFFRFYDEPSEEIILLCKRCTKYLLNCMKKDNEIFTEDQRKVWLKIRSGKPLCEEEIKKYVK